MTAAMTDWKYEENSDFATPIEERGITIQSPVTLVPEEAAGEIVTRYWSIRNMDDDWTIWWSHNVSRIAADFGVKEDAVRIIVQQQQFPQARVFDSEGEITCHECDKSYFFTSRYQLEAMLKQIRDGELTPCLRCRAAEREAKRLAVKQSRAVFAREHPWTLDSDRIRRIRAGDPRDQALWGVHESIAARKTVCRECGESMSRETRRLSFSLAGPTNQVRIGHIHAEPCTRLGER